MTTLNKTSLKNALATLVRSSGQGGKTKALDVRTLLTDVIDSSVSTINNLLPDEAGNINLNLTGAEEITHAALRAKKIAGQLESEKKYILTDYQTLHQIKYTTVIHTGATESLILQASSVNTFYAEVYSVQFPNDVLNYDIDNVTCEDGTTLRKGFITYRKDTIKKLETYYDFRSVKFRRWKVIAQPYSDTTTYRRENWNVTNSPYVLAADGHIHGFKGPVATDLVGNNPMSNRYGNNNWQYLLHTQFGLYVIPNPTSLQVGIYTLLADPADFQDYYTFNTSLGLGNSGEMSEISIGKHTGLNNIIFVSTDNGITVTNNIIGSGSYDVSLLNNNIRNNNFGTGFRLNILNMAVGNSIEKDLRNCSMLSFFEGNEVKIQMAQCCGFFFQFNVMKGGVDRFLPGEDCTYNFAFAYVGQSSVGAQFTGNIISRNFSGNFMGQAVNSNMFLSFFQNSTIYGAIVASTFSQWVNRFEAAGQVYGCTFKAKLWDTKVGVNFNFNSFNGDVIASGGSKNYFADNCHHNVFANNVTNTGTASVPLKISGAVFNQEVNGFALSDPALSFDKTVVNVDLINKTIAQSLSNITLNFKSPDGSLWSATVDNNGALITAKVI